jgi:hypothetical protein
MSIDLTNVNCIVLNTWGVYKTIRNGEMSARVECIAETNHETEGETVQVINDAMTISTFTTSITALEITRRDVITVDDVNWLVEDIVHDDGGMTEIFLTQD